MPFLNRLSTLWWFNSLPWKKWPCELYDDLAIWTWWFSIAMLNYRRVFDFVSVLTWRVMFRAKTFGGQSHVLTNFPACSRSLKWYLVVFAFAKKKAQEARKRIEVLIHFYVLASGKLPHNYGKPPFLMWTSTINVPFLGDSEEKHVAAGWSFWSAVWRWVVGWRGDFGAKVSS